MTTSTRVLPWMPRHILDALRIFHAPRAGDLESRLGLSVILSDCRDSNPAWAPHVARRLTRHAPGIGPLLLPVLANRSAVDAQVEFAARILHGCPGLVPDALVLCLAERAPGVAPTVILDLIPLPGGSARDPTIPRLILGHWARSSDPALRSAATSLRDGEDPLERPAQPSLFTAKRP